MTPGGAAQKGIHMSSLAGRVAVVTGAGRGLGREHALMLASHGAKVVVNDLGVASDGAAPDASPADEVVAAIVAAGGEAVANADDCASWAGASALVHTALDVFGELDIVINNAGILRDASLARMTEEDFDEVVRVHLKGHFAAKPFCC